MNQLRSKVVIALVVACCSSVGTAGAAAPLPAATRLVAADGAAAPTTVAFTIAATQDLTVTLTDLQIPSALVSAGIVVTHAGAITGSALLAAPAATATIALPGAIGDYTLSVFGVPNTGASVGTFTVCVAPKPNPANCIHGSSSDPAPSISGNITARSTAKDSTVSTLSTNLIVVITGLYTFTFADLQFPVALAKPPLVALFQGSMPVIPPGQTAMDPGIKTGTAITLSAGIYTLFGIAQADPAAKAGLYGITVSGPPGVAALLDRTIPVGLANVAAPFNNPSMQDVTLRVIDYGFPGALASASALLTSRGTVLGTANAAGGAVAIPAAPAGTLELWTFGTAGATPGTYSADVAAGSTELHTVAQGVQSATAPATFAYAFVVPQPLLAGSHQATAADLQFPSQLSALSFAVAQGGVIVKRSPSAATLNFTATPGTAILLASAQAPAAGSVSGNGLFDVNIQSSGASAQLIYDKTQAVGTSATLFDAQTLTLGTNGNFDASLTDLKFPAAFDNLSLVVSRGSQVLGKIYGGGIFSFAGSPGTYQLTFVATPAAAQQFGLYGVSVVSTPPTITLTSNVSTAVTGSAVTLSWSASNAVSCTASGGSWTGSKATTATSESLVLSATTTYTLTCTGDGGTKSQSVSVAATAKPASSGGGGELSVAFLLFAGVLLAVRIRTQVRD